VEKRLRALRLARGPTQEAVARIVGVTASQVSKWEHPSGPVPQPRNLRRLARLYGVTVDELSAN
jgi:transcriptional regulator with XRE-family HTH domain